MTEKFRKIDEFTGCRMTIMPVSFADHFQTKFGKIPCMIAEVTIHWPSENQALGALYVFNRPLINQVKQLWQGRPIKGTLRKSQGNEFTILHLDEVTS